MFNSEQLKPPLLNTTAMFVGEMWCCSHHLGLVVLKEHFLLKLPFHIILAEYLQQRVHFGRASRQQSSELFFPFLESNFLFEHPLRSGQVGRQQ